MPNNGNRRFFICVPPKVLVKYITRVAQLETLISVCSKLVLRHVPKSYGSLAKRIVQRMDIEAKRIAAISSHQ